MGDGGLMSVRIIQTCDVCTADRDLKSVREIDIGGWRTIDKKTICADCLSDLFKSKKPIVDTSKSNTCSNCDTPIHFKNGVWYHTEIEFPRHEIIPQD